MAPLMQYAAWMSVVLAGAVQDPAVKKLDPPQVLVPPALAKDLNLDAEQRKKIDDLEQEYNQQRKTALTLTMLKVKTIMDKVERDEEPAPALAVTALVTGTMLDLKRTQAAFEKKVAGLLTEEQQKKFTTWQKLRPKDKREGRPLPSGEALREECVLRSAEPCHI